MKQKKKIIICLCFLFVFSACFAMCCRSTIATGKTAETTLAENTAEATTAAHTHGTTTADHTAETTTAESAAGTASTPETALIGEMAETAAAGLTAIPGTAADGFSGLADVDQSASTVTEITFTAVGDNLINEVLYGQAEEYALQKENGLQKESGQETDEALQSEDTEEPKQAVSDALLEKSTGKYDFSPMYAQIAPFIRQHDVNWIDIETLMTDTCEPSGYPAFSTPGDSARALYDAGWRVFSICSNHTYDLGTEGIEQTLDFWRGMKEEAEKDSAAGKTTGEDKEPQSEICTTGLWENGREEEIPVYFCKGKKLAFLTYTFSTNDIPTPEDAPARVIYLDEEELMEKQIRLASEQADAVIVSLHWGEEYSHEETQEQRELAQRVADMGADLIIGGHPHVVQGAEMLTASDGRKVFCAYSLGNFLCAQNAMPDPDAMIGLVLSCTFRFEDEGLTVTDCALIPIVTDYREDYADDHTVLYADYSEEDALAHGMRTMFGFEQFDYAYVRDMLTEVVGPEYLQLP